ncbi:hypothetical protein KEM54_004449 [Ascosphaera aggregata]|nr:hypothetical protein KEM54_004449 [Ascosphaera aggregata]
MYYDNYAPLIDGAQADPAVASAMHNIVGGAELEVRVGYFGICIQPDGGSFVCNNNATILADIVNADQDPLNLIWVAKTFRDAVAFPYLTHNSMATYGISGSEHNHTRLWKRECEERRWCVGYGDGLVWVCLTYDFDGGHLDYDFEHFVV